MPAWKQLRRQIGARTPQRGKRQLPEKYKFALKIAGPTGPIPKRFRNKFFEEFTVS
jgi:hypothetical protein